MEYKLHIRTDCIDEFLSSFLCRDIFIKACEEGVSERTLEILLRRVAPDWKEAVEAAARGGHVHVFDWMTERTDGRGPWTKDWENAVDVAASHGHLNAVKWLCNQGIEKCILWGAILVDPSIYVKKRWLNAYCIASALTSAASHGHLELVQWIYSREYICRSDRYPIEQAIANGHLAVAKFLRSMGEEIRSINAMNLAAENGHLQMLQWLQATGLLNCTKNAMDGAARNGHLEVVKWLHENRTEGCSSDALSYATHYGHLEVAKWLYDNVHTTFHLTTALSMNKCRHLEILQWINSHFEKANYLEAMLVASKNGDLEVLEWLHKHKLTDFDSYALQFATQNGHVKVVQWFWVHYRDEFDAVQVLRDAAAGGHLDIVRWLCDNNMVDCSRLSIVDAASFGHLDVVLYFLENRSEGFPSAWVQHSRAFEVQCMFDPDSNPHSNRVNRVQLNRLQSLFETRPSHIRGCLACLAQIAADNKLIAILDWVKQFGLKLRSSAPIHRAVYFGNWELLKWFDRNGYKVCDPDLLELAIIYNKLDTAHWLLKHGYAINPIDLDELWSLKRKMPLLRWIVEHGPPLSLSVARELIISFDHGEIAAWVSESHRVEIVLEAIQMNKKALLWWIFERTRFECETSHRTIRDGIQSAPTKTQMWFVETFENSTVCGWCVLTAQKEQSQVARPTKLRRRE
ncbi:hypothetical protein PHMEG_00012259 [Phytophthora megakarya]|uniref:Uncharacterized protein n=1 Tax=Phytophthora megakarya TaxID=4795 RepID=A0A225WAM8_9STRA|nr:hypothetical protein PHMEG_00012259 [Phytophthora megakarya]